MSLSERQKLLRLQEYAKEENEKVLDIFNCVERLHDTDLRKAIVIEKGEWVLAKIPRRNRPPSKASFRRLVLALPKHVLACLLSHQPAHPPDEATSLLTDCSIASMSHFSHIAKALQLLCNLCDSASQNRSLRAELLHSKDFALELVDCVNMVLISMAGPESQTCLDAAQAQASMQEALDHASMVPHALRVLAYAFSSEPSQSSEQSLNWDTTAETLFQHPRGSIFLEAAFDAVRTLVLAVKSALTSPDTSSEDVYNLAFSAGGAMELLSYFCTAPLFYHRLMLHDPSGAAPLRLVLACLSLHDAPLAAPPYSRLHAQAQGLAAAASPPPSMPPIPAAPAGPLAAFAHAQPPYSTAKGRGAAELLAARGFALVVMLAEYEEPSYTDQLFEHEDVTKLAQQVLHRAADYIAQVLLRPATSTHPAAPGEPQMSINILRAAEMLCDDSNFKAGLVQRLSRDIAQLLCLDQHTFRSRWCAGEEAVTYHSKDDILVNSVSGRALDMVESLYEASKKMANTGGKLSKQAHVVQQLALERAVLLYKLIGNLHCQNEDVTPTPDSFVARLASSLHTHPSALKQALQNMQQLHAVVLPFAPPIVSEDMELVGQVDVDLFLDLIAQLEGGSQQPQPQTSAASGPAPDQPQPRQQHQYNLHHRQQQATGLPPVGVATIQSVQAEQQPSQADQQVPAISYPMPHQNHHQQQQQQSYAPQQLSSAGSRGPAVPYQAAATVSSAMPVFVPRAIGGPPTITTGAPLTFTPGSGRPSFMRP